MFSLAKPPRTPRFLFEKPSKCLFFAIIAPWRETNLLTPKQFAVLSSEFVKKLSANYPILIIILNKLKIVNGKVHYIKFDINSNKHGFVEFKLV